MSWDSCFSHGNKMQELFVSYMETNYNYKFMAGDRNGKTQNIDYLEEITHSQYVYPNFGINGPMLRLKSKKDGIHRNFVMPDELMFFNEKTHQFFDVKNRKIDNLFERYGILYGYSQIAYETGIPVFIALIVWEKESGKYCYYVHNVRNILEEYTSETEYNSEVYLDISKFKKI